jgi:hypothetical protein
MVVTVRINRERNVQKIILNGVTKKTFFVTAKGGGVQFALNRLNREPRVNRGQFPLL